MRLVPTPIRNNPTSACMSHPVGINSLGNHSTVGKVLVDALGQANAGGSKEIVGNVRMNPKADRQGSRR